MEAKAIEQLKVEHRKIDQEIQQEYAKGTPDDAHISELKRRKLKIKDQIAQAGAA